MITTERKFCIPELMLVINSKEVNEQLGTGMKTYEMASRQVLSDGTYLNPYGVIPMEFAAKQKITMILICDV